MIFILFFVLLLIKGNEAFFYSESGIKARTSGLLDVFKMFSENNVVLFQSVNLK